MISLKYLLDEGRIEAVEPDIDVAKNKLEPTATSPSGSLEARGPSQLTTSRSTSGAEERCGSAQG